MKEHRLYDADPVQSDEGTYIATVYPAEAEHVRLVLDAPVETGDGRSEWCWIRLSNGELALAVFPQGDTYLALEGTFR